MPWHAGLATGIGSLPGTDPGEAARLVAGELPGLPHLVELPERGPGADLIGRTGALLTDMPIEAVPSGWRLARRPGRDLRRARDFLAWDLDAAEQHFAGSDWLKVQLAGPWTLAAHIETPSGHRAVTDHGATADLAASLSDGLAAQLADLARRLPGTNLVIQFDEPALPAVLAGTLPTASGFGVIPAVARTDAEQALAQVIDTLDGHPTVVHCCHREAPLALFRSAGFDAVSLDFTVVGEAAAELDPIGELIEAGGVLAAGLVPGSSQPESFDHHAAASPLLETWHRLGLERARLDQVVVTPTCGLARASGPWTRRALTLARDSAALLADQAQQ